MASISSWMTSGGICLLSLLFQSFGGGTSCGIDDKNGVSKKIREVDEVQGQYILVIIAVSEECGW